MKTLRIVMGVVGGYALMAVLITLVQETWFGGVDYYESSTIELGVAGFFTTLSAAGGAFAGTLLAGSPGRIVAKVMSLLVVTETTVLMIGGELTGPLWFDIAAAGGLIIGIVAGAELALRMPRRKRAATA